MLVETFQYVCTKHGLIAARGRDDTVPAPESCSECGGPLRAQLVGRPAWSLVTLVH